MPASNHRHRRSPFKRTSFQRTSSISSSITSISPSSDTTPTLTPAQPPSIHHSPSATPSHMHMNMHTPHTSPLAIPQAANIKIQANDQETKIFGHRSLNPGLEYEYSTACHGYRSSSSSSSSSSPSQHRSKTSPSPPSSSAHALTPTTPKPLCVKLKPESKSKSKVSANPKSHSRRPGILRDITSEEEEEEGGGGGGKHQDFFPNCKKKSLRPFLRKFVHSLSFRSGFRLIGWIEDPVALGDCGLYQYRTGYAYGGRMGDARLWDEARRGILEGSFH
ncbi:hypothetical protein MFRU_047g00330 [Monilinia fructicola]|nr:hypothetical protein MFRU_047g00330 [Monilinia fructicola]